MKKQRIFNPPKFLAYKLQDTSLIHNKKSPICTIDEINNENSQNNLDSPDFFAQEKTEKSPNANIFSSKPSQETLEYHDNFIGPRFDDSGNLIKYSIVGKPDRFLRKFNQSAENRRIPYDSKASIYSPKNVSSISFLEQENTANLLRESIAFKRKTLSKKTTFINAVQNVTSVNKMVPKRNIVRLNRNQVFYEIQKVEDRIRINSSNDQMLFQALKPNDQLYMNKEQRIFKKNEKNHEIWENQLDLLKKKVPRSKSEHLMQTSGDYRFKKEKANILDLLKTDYEKFGSKYWYHSIRNNLNEELKHLGNETLQAFKKSRLNLKSNQIEMIRFINDKNNENSTKKLLDLINLRKGAIKDEYLKSVLKANKKKIDIIQPIESIEGNLKGFEVNFIITNNYAFMKM